MDFTKSINSNATLLLESIVPKKEEEIFAEKYEQQSQRIIYLLKSTHELKNVFIAITSVVDSLSDLKFEYQKDEDNFEALKALCDFGKCLLNDILDNSGKTPYSVKVKKSMNENSKFRILDVLNFCANVFPSLKYFKTNDKDIDNTKLSENSSVSNQVRFIADFVNIKSSYYVRTLNQNRLKQVILNLLINSFKFTFTGEIKLLCDKISSDTLSIVIQDTGLGMTKDQCEHLFDPSRFCEKNNSNCNKYGSGIGLSVVYDILSAYNIKINCESQPFGGSRFSFELKFEELYEEEDELNSSYILFPPKDMKEDSSLDFDHLNSHKFKNKMYLLNTDQDIYSLRDSNSERFSNNRGLVKRSIDPDLVINIVSTKGNTKTTYGQSKTETAKNYPGTPKLSTTDDNKQQFSKTYNHIKSKKYVEYRYTKESTSKFSIDNIKRYNNYFFINNNTINEFSSCHEREKEKSLQGKSPSKKKQINENILKGKRSNLFQSTSQLYSIYNDLIKSPQSCQDITKKKNKNKERSKKSLAYHQLIAYSTNIKEILVCDDEQNIGNSVKVLLDQNLKMFGYKVNVRVFNNEIICLLELLKNIIKNKRTLMIFMDQNLNYIEGIEIFNFLRKISIFSDIQFYLLSADDIASNSATNGIDGIYKKPISKSTVHKIIFNNKNIFI